MGYRQLRLCSNNGGFEAIPDPPFPLDLATARAALESAGVPVIDARVMLIANLPPEVTISRGGRLLLKTRDPETAGRAFERLRALLGLPAAEEGAPLPSAVPGQVKRARELCDP